MPQPNKIPLAFAASGDKNAIPESTETTGLASWREGFPAITSAPFSEGGIAPKRADFNGIFYALSQAVMWLQQGGVYAYDVNTDYEAGNVVLDAGGLYVANAANGPSSAVVQPSSDTTGATWKLVRLNLATPTAAGYMSSADKAKLDGLISTDATQSAAGYMSAADKTKLDGLLNSPVGDYETPVYTTGNGGLNACTSIAPSLYSSSSGFVRKFNDGTMLYSQFWWPLSASNYYDNAYHLTYPEAFRTIHSVVGIATEGFVRPVYIGESTFTFWVIRPDGTQYTGDVPLMITATGVYK